MIKQFVMCPSPRDIPQFHKEFAKIKGYDKFWIRYRTLLCDILNTGRAEFLKEKNKEYTHFVIITDDLVLKQEHFDRLQRDLEYLQQKGQTTVACIGGYCNVDYINWRHAANFSMKRVSRYRKEKPKKQYYNFVSMEDVAKWRKEKFAPNEKYPFLRVEHTGCTLFALPRAIMEKLVFRNDSDYHPEVPKEKGCCEDLMMSNDLLDMNMTMYIDLDLHFLHLQKMPGIEQYWMIGLKEPISYFERY